MVLGLSSKTTYRLWVVKGRYKVSAGFCDYPARSRTDCWRSTRETESAGDPKTIQQDHVHAVGERWERQKSTGIPVFFLVQYDHAPSASWRRARRIEFKVTGSVGCLLAAMEEM